MEELYSRREAERMRARAQRGLIAACALLIAALTACVILCVGVRGGNAERRLIWVIGLFTLAGWIAIPLISLLYRPSLSEYRHMSHMLSGLEEETYEGILHLSGETVQVPRSIRVRRLTLTGEDGEAKTLHLDARFASRMPQNGVRARVRAAGRYVTAFEVCHEED